MKQNTMQQFKSECARVIVSVENEMPIGVFHDFLMEIKGLMVERMVVAHKEQEEQMKAAMQLPPHESEVSALPDQPQECTPQCA